MLVLQSDQEFIPERIAQRPVSGQGWPLHDLNEFVLIESVKYAVWLFRTEIRQGLGAPPQSAKGVSRTTIESGTRGPLLSRWKTPQHNLRNEHGAHELPNTVLCRLVWCELHLLVKQ